MIASAGDIARFALAVRGGVLVKPATLDTMWAPQRLKDGRVSSYGYGWVIQERAGQRVVGHSGGQQGCSTMLLMNTATGTVVVVMANMDQVGAAPLASAILDVVEGR